MQSLPLDDSISCFLIQFTVGWPIIEAYSAQEFLYLSIVVT